MALADRQLAMLERMAALEPPPFFMGGLAVDALVAGTVTREHGDFDSVSPRSELGLLRGQAEELGFEGFETVGGRAVLLFAQAPGDVRLDLGIADEENGRLRDASLPDRTEMELAPL
jgi:hypothetical protein